MSQKFQFDLPSLVILGLISHYTNNSNHIENITVPLKEVREKFLKIGVSTEYSFARKLHRLSHLGLVEPIPGGHSYHATREGKEVATQLDLIRLVSNLLDFRTVEIAVK